MSGLFRCALISALLLTTHAIASEGSVEEIEVHLVEIPILAVDGEGRPIGDLAVEDLRAQLDGREVALDSVMTPGWLRAAGASLPHAKLYVDLGARGDLAETGDGIGGDVLVFIDLIHARASTAEDPASSIKGFAKGLLEGGHRVAIASFDGAFRLETPFTGDAARVERAIQAGFERKPKAADPLRRLANLARGLSNCEYVPDNPFSDGEDERDPTFGSTGLIADRSCARSAISSYVQEVSWLGTAFYRGIEAAIRYAGTVRAGSQIVAITRGETLDPMPQARSTFLGIFDPSQSRKIADIAQGGGAVDEVLERLGQAAARLGVRVHFVAAGARSSSASSMVRRYLRGGGEDPVDVAIRNARRDLRRIVSGSGGAFLAGGPLGSLLGSVEEMESGLYSVYVYEEAGLNRDQIAKVDIRSKRRGVEIVPGRAQPWGNRSIPGISARFVLPEGTSDGGPARQGFRLDFALDPEDYREGEDLYMTNLALELRLMTVDGRMVTSFYDLFRHTLPADQFGKAATTALSVPGWVEAEPGKYRLDALLRCPLSGREASAVVEFEVPESAADAS
jgi:hypothetical protein